MPRPAAGSTDGAIHETNLTRRAFAVKGRTAKRAALHAAGHVVTPKLKQGRRQIEQVRATNLAAHRASGGVQNEGAELGVVAVVGPGVVLLDVNPAVTDAADR